MQYMFKYLPNKARYGIIDKSSRKIIREVKSAQEASSIADRMNEDNRMIVGFGEHVPAFMQKRVMNGQR